MSRLALGLVIALSFLLSYGFRVTQGIDEAGRALLKAYNHGAKQKAPYLYNKTKGYREIASILASEADDVGARIFAIRTMNTASRAISASFIGVEELTPIESLPKELEEREDITFKLIDIKEIKKKMDFLRANRALNCSPAELGRAEAYYDALLYEIRRDEPNTALLLKFFNEFSTESKVAESKLRVAMSNELECYTGKKVVRREEKPEEPKEEEPKPQEEVKEEPQEVKEEKKPELVEEPLKITARVHFDFDRADIRKEYIPILNEVVKTLKENEFVKVRIEGFTDVIGSKEYNEELARKRAEAVKSYLVERGVPEDKIEVVGFGKERFIASNEEDIGRLTNRRVEFIVIKLRGE